MHKSHGSPIHVDLEANALWHYNIGDYFQETARSRSGFNIKLKEYLRASNAEDWKNLKQDVYTDQFSNAIMNKSACFFDEFPVDVEMNVPGLTLPEGSFMPCTMRWHKLKDATKTAFDASVD